jgi:hypothetical protein
MSKTLRISRHTIKRAAVAMLVLAALPAMAATQIVSQLPSSAAISNVGGGASYNTIVTPDGRFVLFASTSANLAFAPNGLPMREAVPAHMNVFVRDRQSGITTLVSVDAAGIAGGNGDSFPSAISTNGQFAFFESSASDLVPGNNNGTNEIFVRDTVNNITTLVSVSTNGLAGNGDSHNAAITPDGRYVAFDSAANNLVAGDTNGIPDVFVRDLQLGVTTLASPGAQATTNAFNSSLTAGSSSEWPLISADGRYVAFFSTAVGLVTNVTSIGELYVRDLVQGSTTWVSTNARLISSSEVVGSYAMSTNGQWIAYQTTGGTPAGLVFLYDVATEMSEGICTNGVTVSSLDFDARDIDISADGEFVAFILAGVSNGTSIQLWDAETGTTSLISGGTPGAYCDFPRLDLTGRYVAFISDETSLTTNSDGAVHIYLRDTSTSDIQLVDVGMGGAAPISHIATPFALSADGSVLGFDCLDGATSINSNKSDAFLRDFGSNTTEIISSPAPTLPSLTPLNPSGLTTSSASSNGQDVGFTSSADGIVSTDTNGYADVYVHDFVSGLNTLVSVSVYGPYSGNGPSWQPVISSNGRYVAFSSYATNLVANDTNNSSDIFLRDLQTGSTTLVSRDATGSGEGNSISYTPQISADGQHVLFYSLAINLTTNKTFTGVNTFWRDIQAGATYAITTGGTTVAAMTPDGSNVFFGTGSQLYLWKAQSHSATNVASVSSPVLETAMSPDAHWAAFETVSNCYVVNLIARTNWLLAAVAPTSQTHCQFSGDSQSLAYLAEDNKGTNQVYLYNFQNSAHTLVSQSYNSTAGGNGNCDSPTISTNGRFVAYRSAANNLVPGDTNGAPGIFLYDGLTGGTTLVSVSQFGAFSGNGRSLSPFFSSDGQNLLFESWASDLAPGDFNESSDVFALSLSEDGSGGSTNAAPPLDFTGISFETTNGEFSPGQPLTLTWVSVPGGGYQVQFKNNLTDPQWQPLDSPATVVGSQGQIIDFSPGPVSRFYRLVSF